MNTILNSPQPKRTVATRSDRGTTRQIQERVETVAKLLGHGATLGEIKRAVLSQYGIGWRMCQNYVQRAKELLLKEASKDREQLFAEAYSFYTSVIKSSTSTVLEKIRARERLDALLGLDAPRILKGEISGPDGTPLLAGIKVYLPEKQALIETSPPQPIAVIPERVPTNANGSH